MAMSSSQAHLGMRRTLLIGTVGVVGVAGQQQQSGHQSRVCSTSPMHGSPLQVVRKDPYAAGCCGRDGDHDGVDAGGENADDADDESCSGTG